MRTKERESPAKKDFILFNRQKRRRRRRRERNFSHENDEFPWTIISKEVLMLRQWPYCRFVRRHLGHAEVCLLQSVNLKLGCKRGKVDGLHLEVKQSLLQGEMCHGHAERDARRLTISIRACSMAVHGVG